MPYQGYVVFPVATWRTQINLVELNQKKLKVHWLDKKAASQNIISVMD